MDWKGRRESGNVEDRRSQTRRGLAIGGSGSLILLLIYLLLGGNPLALLNQLQVQEGGNEPYQPTAAEQEQVKFVKQVLAGTEDVWTEIFREELGRPYEEPRLVLFRGSVDSACGYASAAVGPFYCPGDQQVYLDLSFFEELKQKLGAPGDFAQAYVIAHEVGHHVQKLLGISDKVHRAQQQDQRHANELSVRLELQADFLAGVWAHHADAKWQVLEEGDIAEALNAAKKIGDDYLQRKAGGYVRPDAFTHGTSQQREAWLRYGLKTGDVSKRDLLFSLDYDDLMPPG